MDCAGGADNLVRKVATNKGAMSVASVICTHTIVIDIYTYIIYVQHL